MKKARKLALTLMSVLCALTFVLGLAACGGGQSAKDAIEAYLLPQDNQLVDADFTLPKKIGIENGVEVEWKSNNDAITVEEGTADTYNAKVTLKDEVTPVTLTISSGSASKDFIVRVDALNVYTFMNHYGNDDYDAASFPQRKTAQKEDFTLDSTYTIQGKTAEIEWEVKSEADQAYLVVQKDGSAQKAHVIPGDDLVKVKLTATFKYNGTATKDYEISISPDLDHRQLVYKMYSEAGFPIEFDGYVVHVYTAANDSKYGPMASFYAVDSDFCSGYYIWQAALESEEDVAKVVPGAHFTFSGDYAKNYNGLWETNGYEEGTAVFDGAAPINVEEKIYAFDTDLISGIESATWQMSRLVSLTGWTVKTAWNETKLVLENSGKSIDIYTSKYVTTDDDATTALTTKLAGLKVGDIVNIKGILGYNNGYRIQPRTADDIETATAAATYENAAKIAAAQTAVNNAVKTNKFDSLVKEAKENIEMPAEKEGVAISYRLAKKVTDGAPVSIDGNKISVNPQITDKTSLIEVTYTIGDYKGMSVFTIRSWAADEQAIVDEVYKSLNKLRIDEIVVAGEVDLPEVETFGAAITWTIGNEEKPQPEWASISGNKLVITYLPDEATSISVYATITFGSAEAKTVFFNVKVSAAPNETFKAITAPAAGDYIFGLYQANLKQWLYSAGTVTSNTSGTFGATVTNPAEAAVYTLAEGTEGWKITLKSSGQFLELNENHQICYVDASTQEWKWDVEYKVFTFTVGSDVYYIGTYNSFNTFSASKTSYLSGGTNFIAQYGNMVEATDETRAEEVLANLSLKPTVFSEVNTEGIDLPTSTMYKAQVVWSLKEASNAYVSVADNKLKINALPEEDTEVILVVKVTVGEKTVSDEVTITVKPAFQFKGEGTKENPFSVAEAIEIGAGLSDSGAAYYMVDGEAAHIYIKGFVTNVGTVNNYQNENKGVQNVLIADEKGGKTTLKLSFVYYDDEVMVKVGDGSVNPLHVGDEVVVWGWLERYNGGTATVYSSPDKQYPTFTTWNKAELTDDDKANDVLNSLKLTKTTFNALESNIELDVAAENEYSATVTWAVTGGNEQGYVSITENKLNILKLPTEDSVTVTLTATAKIGTSTTKTKEFKITVQATDVVEKGTEDNPYTVAEALALGESLTENGQWYSVNGEAVRFHVKGYITNAGKTYSNTSGRDIMSSVEIADAKGGSPVLLLYSIAWNEVVTKPADGNTPLKVGDFIVVYGYMKLYGTGDSAKLEMDKNGDVDPEIVKWTKAELTDDDKAEEVLNSLKLTKTTFNALENNIQLPNAAENEYGATVTWAVTSGNDGNYVSISIDKLNILKLPTEGSVTVTLTATVRIGTSVTKTKQFEITVQAADVVEKGTADNPYTVTEALAAAKALTPGSNAASYSENVVYVTGYVVDFGSTWTSSSQNWYRFYIADSADSTKSSADAIMVYRLYPADTNNLLKVENDLAVGATITVCGYLQNYASTNGAASGTPEINSRNSTNITVTKYNDPRTLQDKAKTAVAAAKKALGTEIAAAVSEFTLPVSTVTGITLEYSVSGTGATLTQDGKALTITHGEADTQITVTITTTEVTALTDNTVTLTVKQQIVISDGDYVFDFKDVELPSGNAQTYSNDEMLALLNGLTDPDIVATVTSDAVYKGNSTGGPQSGGGMIKFGKNSASGTLTINFAKNISKVVIDCVAWSDSEAGLTVNSNSETMPTVRGEVTVEFDEAVSQLVIKTSKRALIYKITVTIGTKAVGPTPEEKVEQAKTELESEIEKLVSEKNLTNTPVGTDSPITLPEIEGANINWVPTTTQDGIQISEYVKIEGSTLTVLKLAEPGKGFTVKITGTVTLAEAAVARIATADSASATVEFEIKIAEREKTDAEKAQDLLATVDVTSIDKQTYTATTQEGAEIALPVGELGSAAVWTVASGNEGNYVSITANKLKIEKLPGTGSVQITLKLTVTSGSGSAEKSVTITVSADSDMEELNAAKEALMLSTTEITNTKVNDSIDLPATIEGHTDVAVAWAGTSDYCTVAGNKLTVTKIPSGKAEKVTVTATLTYHQKSVTKTFEITINNNADNDKVQTAKEALDDGETFFPTENRTFSATGDMNLPATAGTLTVTWAIAEKSTADAQGLIEAADGGKFNIIALPTDANKQITFTATVTSGDFTASVEFVITLEQAAVQEVEEEIAVLDFTQGWEDTDGTTTGYKDVTFTMRRGNILWTFNDINNNNHGWSHVRIGHKTDATVAMITTSMIANKISKVALTYNAILSLSKASCVTEYKLELSEDESFETISATITLDTMTKNDTFEIPVSNQKGGLYYRITIRCSALGGSDNGLIKLEKISYTGYPLSDKDKVTAALSELTIDPTDLSEDLVLPATTVEGVTLKWEVTEGMAAATVNEQENKLIVTRQEADTDVRLKVTASIGDVSDEKTFDLKVLSKSTVVAKTWKLVKDISNLAVGDQIIIVYGQESLGEYDSGNNRYKAASITIQDDVATIDDTIVVITLTEATTEGAFGFQIGVDQYLYAAGGSSKDKKLKAASWNTVGKDGEWKITISGSTATITAQGTCNQKILCYNSSTNGGFFNCYSSVQKAVSIYKLS